MKSFLGNFYRHLVIFSGHTGKQLLLIYTWTCILLLGGTINISLNGATTIVTKSLVKTTLVTYNDTSFKDSSYNYERARAWKWAKPG